MGDNKSQDMLVGQVADYGETSPRVSRQCLAPFADIYKIPHYCHPINHVMITQLCMASLGSTFGYTNLEKEYSLGEHQSPPRMIPGIELSGNFDNWAVFLDSKTQKERKAFIRLRNI